MTTNKPNIGPSTLATPGTPGGPGFTLSSEEWIKIQTYVDDALALPTNDNELKMLLGEGAPANLSDFQKLLAAYRTINEHCSTWQDTTFPSTVSLASDIYNYGTTKVPIFYPPILVQARILERDPDDENAKAALKAILDSLSQQATAYANNAEAVAVQVQEFAKETKADKETMVGPHGDAGLVKYYDDEYGSTSAEVAELTKEIEDQKAILKAANKEYDHDVIVASTTPCYAWVWPIGTIAGAVVAGVYGDKAVKAKERAHAAEKQIKALDAELQADANLMISLGMARDSMKTLVDALVAALPIIQKIQGVWAGISDDLASIVKLIDDDIRNVPPLIMGLGVDEAIAAWEAVAVAANAYRHNAYVTVEGGAAQSMEAWRVATLVAPTMH
jgi:hypothetical protein